MSYQLIPYPLPSISITLSSSSQSFTTALRDLPKQRHGRIAHLHSITFETDLDPTYTAVPTVTGHNSLVNNMQVFDGNKNLFSGNWNVLRQFERLEHGGVPYGDPEEDGASTNNRYWIRTWHVGPPHMAGSPSDFLIPCAALENGEIRYTIGVLTDISADTTAATAVIRPTAWLALRDDIIIPPVYERVAYTLAAADVNLTGRALYAFLGMGNSASWDAIAAGDFGAFTVDAGAGELIGGVDAELLGRGYASQFAMGSIGGIQGEPRATLDTSQSRQVNLATPTALEDTDVDLQAIMWTPPRGMLSKLVAHTESVLRVRWNGSQASGIIIAGRFLEQTPTMVASVAARALGKLPVRHGATKVKTLTKDEYKGPRPEFMPYKIKVQS